MAKGTIALTLDCAKTMFHFGLEIGRDSKFCESGNCEFLLRQFFVLFGSLG
jgi:hypothetical protein